MNKNGYYLNEILHKYILGIFLFNLLDVSVVEISAESQRSASLLGRYFLTPGKPFQLIFSHVIIELLTFRLSFYYK